MKSHLIFFVSDQDKSTSFYEAILGFMPRLNVSGMTEFQINEGSILGLMPETGIKKLLGNKITDPSLVRGVPRAELYLITRNAEGIYRRAVEIKAPILSPFEKRSWGHVTAYFADPDGHIIAVTEG